MTTPPVCNYEGSDYQTSFWEQGGREYEDRAEAIALERLLPNSGRLLLELGAGAGRNTPRYAGFERVVLVDYSTTQLEQAQSRLGQSDRYIYVAADIYRLPFREGLFDAATMIRTLHHMADAPRALMQVRNALQAGAIFILEYANKLNLKAILRYWLGRQKWNPFSLEPVEFVALNFDFHPRAIRNWLNRLGFSIEKTLTVSHFRLGWMKRIIPPRLLAALDGFFQPTGEWFQLTPSVFVKSKVEEPALRSPSAFVGSLSKGQRSQVRININIVDLFKCPECGSEELKDKQDHLECPRCKARWPLKDGIYDFRAQA